MSIRQLTSSVILLLLAGSFGYYSGALGQATMSFMPAEGRLVLDHYYTPQSFSEVENAKALLSALSEQFVGQLQAERIADIAKAKRNSLTGYSAGEPHLREVIAQLEKGVVEFRGTDQELRLIRVLLFTLKKAKLYDRWTDVYLDTLYQHPTHELIGNLATEAATISKAAGRQNDILNAFKHVGSIPLDFEAKSQVATALIHASTERRLAAN